MFSQNQSDRFSALLSHVDRLLSDESLSDAEIALECGCLPEFVRRQRKSRSLAVLPVAAPVADDDTLPLPPTDAPLSECLRYYESMPVGELLVIAQRQRQRVRD